jgi:hypothetical protein
MSPPLNSILTVLPMGIAGLNRAFPEIKKALAKRHLLVTLTLVTTFALLTVGISAAKADDFELARAFQTGGYAAFSIWVSCSVCIPGYQRTKVFRSWSLSTFVRTWSRLCAPDSVHRICCFFTMRLLTT